jgi:hypothetical protein
MEEEDGRKPGTANFRTPRKSSLTHGIVSGMLSKSLVDAFKLVLRGRQGCVKFTLRVRRHDTPPCHLGRWRFLLPGCQQILLPAREKVRIRIQSVLLVYASYAKEGPFVYGRFHHHPALSLKGEGKLPVTSIQFGIRVSARCKGERIEHDKE